MTAPFMFVATLESRTVLGFALMRGYRAGESLRASFCEVGTGYVLTVTSESADDIAAVASAIAEAEKREGEG